MFKNRNFRLMFLGSFFSALGDSVYFLTLAWLIVDLFNSGTLMGTIMLIVGTVRFLCGMLGGGVVDQVGPRRVMILSNLLRACVMVVMFVALMFGDMEIWYLMTLAVLFGLIDSLYWPASSAMQQRVLQSAGELGRANSMTFTVMRLLTIFGPVLAGYLLLVASYSNIMLVVAVLFIISASLTLQMRFEDDVQKPAGDRVPVKGVLHKFVANIREGYGFLFTQRVLLTMVLTIFFANIGANGVMVLFAFLVKELGWGGDGLGILQASVAAGSIICGLALSIRPFRNPSIYIPVIGFFGQGAMLFVIAFTDGLIGVSASLFVQGMFTALIGVMIPTIIQTMVPKHMMGQVGGIMMTISMASTPFSQFIFGTLTDKYGPHQMFLIAGILEVITAIVAIIYLKKSRVPYALQVGSKGVAQ